MAKKAKGKKAPKKAPKKVASKKKAVPRKRPRQITLPDESMERVRSKRLDAICESIADERDKVNEAKKEEGGLISSALQEMQNKGIQVYKHGGVELARVPGAEKLRVRRVKDEGDAGAEDLEAGDEGGEGEDGSLEGGDQGNGDDLA